MTTPDSPVDAALPDPVRRGLEAWVAGDLDALEQVLDPAVTLHWIRPGPWDCQNREDVMHLLRERQQTGAPTFPVRVEQVSPDTFVVGAECPPGTERGRLGRAEATRVTVAAGLVVAMRQYRSREEARAAGP